MLQCSLIFCHDFLINSLYILSFFVNICFVVLGSGAFCLSVFCFSIWLEVLAFLYLVFRFESGYLVRILHYLCLHIFLVLENQPFFNIILAWSARLWLVILNLADFAQIPFSFLYPLCAGLLLKQQ